MGLRILITVWVALLMTAPLGAQEIDPLTEVLGQVGLDLDGLRFDTFDMSNYGGDEFVLPLFNLMQQRPLKIPYYTDSYLRFFDDSGSKMQGMISFASRRIDEGSRRGLIGNQLDSILAQVARGVDLRMAIDTLHTRLRTPFGAGGAAGATGDLKRVPPQLLEIATVVVLTAAETTRWPKLAFRQAEQKFGMDTMFTKALRVLSWDDDGYDEDFYEFIHHIDWKYLYAGAQDLAAAVDWACDTLSKLELTGNFDITIPTALGSIVLRGEKDHDYPAGEYFLIIDLGGDDTYSGGAANQKYGQNMSVLIDVAGNDKYLAIEDSLSASFGGGVFGYAMLADLAGNDEYHGVNWSQGAGLFGVGCLWDLAGDDRYTAHATAQGAGAFGIGCLYDGGGADIYHAYLMVQGFGFTKGMGILFDVDGDDQYIADDEDLRYPASQTKEHNDSMAQGVGFGWRHDYIDGHSLAGGFGFLYDAAGDDIYTAGLFAQGCAYWYSIGLLADRVGNDSYSGIWYVQGSGAHFGVGYLNDKDGNDSYKATMNMAIGAGHDFTVGMLIDEAGDDSYVAPNLSLGGGNANGIGFFWDKAGRDSYSVTAATTLGRANVAGRRGGLRDSILTLGIFLDTGGEEDTYPVGKDFAKNNSKWTQRGTNTNVPLNTEKGCGGDF